MNIQTYKVDMKLAGRLSQLPDSQKIFGALMYYYAEKTSSKCVDNFVANVKNGTTYCALSNIVPADYWPVPHVYLLNHIQNNKNSENKKVYKEIKKRQYLKIDQIRQLMANSIAARNAYPYIKCIDNVTIHAAIDSVRLDIPGLDPNVYSMPDICFKEITSSNDDETKIKPMDKFQFYMSIDCENNDLANLLEEARAEERPFFLGPRSSQGMNTFYIEKVNKDEQFMDSSIMYLNIGMLLPNKIDLQKSYMKIFTSQRHPYHRVDGWGKQEKSMFLSFIQEGSMIVLDGDDVAKAGKSIQSPYKPEAIVFGNAYLIPIKLGEL